MNTPVVVCVLMYGNYPDLHRQCLQSLIEYTPAEAYTLRIGCNEVCPATMSWLHKLQQELPIRLFVSDRNIMKYPMMRRMFADLDPESQPFLSWFDDDSYVTGPWLQAAMAYMQDHPEIVCIGKQYYTHINKGNMVEWAEKEPWYTGRPWALDNTKCPPLPKFDFCTGGYWTIRTSAIKKLDWPSKSLYHNGGDAALGGALYQNYMEIGQCYDFVQISKAPRRGYSETMVGIKYDTEERGRQAKYLEERKSLEKMHRICDN